MLSRFPKLDVLYVDAFFFAPLLNLMTDKFRAFIGKDAHRLAFFINDFTECAKEPQ